MNSAGTALLTVENGGGNQNDIDGIACHLYDLESWSSDEEFHAKSVMRRRLRDMVDQVNCAKFYTNSGAKITRSLKGILNEVLVDKKIVNAQFAEFCKRVGSLYTEVTANAFLIKPYFDRDPSECDEACYGDHNSCFFKGGCNENNGVFIDKSPSTAVIVVKPTTDRYAAGRMVLWVKDATTAHLLNQYSLSGSAELPRNVFARALEALSGAKVTYQQLSSSDGTLPVYVNQGYMRVTAIEGNFDALTTDYRFYCPECGCLFPSENVHADRDGTTHNIGCCSECCGESDRERYTCDQCGDRIDEDDCRWVNDERYCEHCYERNYFYCESCSTDCDLEGSVTVRNRRGHEETVCEGCADADYFRCHHCDEYHHNDNGIATDDGDTYCEGCASEHVMTCEKCGIVSDDLDDFDGDRCCSDCHVEDEEEAVAV